MQRILMGTLLISMSASAFAQSLPGDVAASVLYVSNDRPSEFNGIYIDPSGSGDSLAIEGVPVNEGETITVLFNSAEFTWAHRNSANEPFVWSHGDCTAHFQPYRQGRRQWMKAWTAGRCKVSFGGAYYRR